MQLLIAGAAGYIGSHCARKALDSGHQVIALDNLSHGWREAVDPRATFVLGDVGDQDLIARLVRDHGIEACLHFAAFIEVGESVQDPGKYYANNVSQTVALLNALRRAGGPDGRPPRLVFSSTAAVYGMAEQSPIEETAPLRPINPYGRTKLMAEQAIGDFAAAYGVGACALRYFNVAGAHPSGQLGEAHEPESHLIPRVLRAAQGLEPAAAIFGTDYPTPDGTCVRDYVHVEDLVDAHLLALDAIKPGELSVYNLGSERGFSVREVIAACEREIGRPIRVEEKSRRAGDPARLVACSRKIERELGWKKRFPDLATIVAHAWRWHREHPRGYRSASSAAETNLT